MAEKDQGDKDKKRRRFPSIIGRSKHKKDEPAEAETKFGPSDEHGGVTEQPRPQKESGPTSPHSPSASPGVSSPQDSRQPQSSGRSQSGSGCFPAPGASQATPPSDSGKGKKKDDKKRKEEEKAKQKQLKEERLKEERLKAQREKELKAQQKHKGGKGKSKEKLPGDQTPETRSPTTPPGHVVSGAARLFPHPTSGDVVGKTGGDNVREKERKPSLASSSEPSSAADFSALTSPSQASGMFSPGSVPSMTEEEKQSYQREIQDLKERLEKMDKEAKENIDKVRRAMSDDLAEKDREMAEELEKKEKQREAAMLQMAQTHQKELQEKESNYRMMSKAHEKAREEYRKGLELKVGELQTSLTQAMAAKEATQGEQETEQKAQEQEIAELQAAKVLKEQESAAKDRALHKTQGEVLQLQKQLAQKEEDLKFTNLELEKLKSVHKTLRDLQESRARLQEKNQREKEQMVREHEAKLQDIKQQYERQLKQREEETQIQMQKELEAALLEEQNKAAEESAQLQQLQQELLEERQQRVREGERIAKEHEAKLQEMNQQHDAEVEKMVKRYEEEMEQKAKEHKMEMDRAGKVVEKGQQNHPDAGTDTRVQMLQKRVQEQNLHLAKEKERMAREHQARVVELKQQHESEMKQKTSQYQEAIERMQKDKENAMEMKLAQAERKHKLSLREKQKELESEAQQDVRERERQLQLKEAEFRTKKAEMESLQQKLVEKDIRISELQSGMFPSSSEYPDGSEGATAAASSQPPAHTRRTSVESREEDIGHLPSNIIDMAHEISQFVDPENVLPQTRFCHHLSPQEVQQVVHAIGNPQLLHTHKPQNYLFAVLPSHNTMHSVLFDYTGCFRDPPEGERELPEGRAEEEDGDVFSSAPSSLQPQETNNLDRETPLEAAAVESDPVKRLQGIITGYEQKLKDVQEEAAKRQQDLEELRKVSEAKVEERDRQIEQLSKQVGAGSEGKFEEYFEQLTKLTEQVTLHEDTEVKLKKNIQDLERVVKRANEQEEQLTQAASDLSTAELEVKQLKEKVRKISVEVAPGDKGEQQAPVASLMDEADDLKVKLQRAATEKEELQQRIHQLEQERPAQKREESPRPEVNREQVRKLEAKFQERLQEAKKLNEEKWQKTVKDLQAKVGERDEQLKLLRATATRRESSLSTSSSISEVSIAPEDPEVEVARLKKELREKERDNESLKVQLGSFERVASDERRIQEHSRGQSREVFKLKQKVEALEKHKEVCEGQTEGPHLDLQTQLEEDNEKLKRDVTVWIEEVKHLRGQVETAGVEKLSLKDELEQQKLSLLAEKISLKRQKDKAMSKVERLEADIAVMQQEHKKELSDLKREKAILGLSKLTEEDRAGQEVQELQARLDEKGSETDVLGLKKALSDSELRRQELSQELHKMKERCEQLRHLYHESEQKHVHLLAVNENLKAQADQVECMTMEMSRSESQVSAQSKEIAALKEQIGKKDDEIAALNAQAQAYKEDFEHERQDREAAAGRMQDTEAGLNYQFHEVIAHKDHEAQVYQSEAKRLQAENYQIVEKFDAMQLELVNHKELLEHTRAQQKETQVQLHESHQRLEKNIADTAKLHDEVLAKTQQVKQYKKQADGYKAQLEQNKAELQRDRAELEQYRSQFAAFHHDAQQREEMDVMVATSESQREATEQELHGLRRERDALKAELHRLKTVEGDFSTAFKREYDQREELEKKYGALVDRFDLQFRDNDQLRMILSQYNIPHPPRLEATPTPQRLPPSTAAADIPRARIQPPHDLTPRSPDGQQMAVSTAYAGRQAVPPQQPHPQQYAPQPPQQPHPPQQYAPQPPQQPHPPQQYAPMGPQGYQHSEQEAYHQQKLQEAIQQKEQRFLLEQKRQHELALQQQQQLQMQGYPDPHGQMRGAAAYPHDQSHSPLGHHRQLLPNRSPQEPARIPLQRRPPPNEWQPPSSGHMSLPIRSITQPIQRDGQPVQLPNQLAPHLQPDRPHSGLQPHFMAPQAQFAPQAMHERHQRVTPYQQPPGGHQTTTPPPQGIRERLPNVTPHPPPPVQQVHDIPIPVAPVQASDQASQQPAIPTPIQETQPLLPQAQGQDPEASGGEDILMKELEGDIAEAAKDVEGKPDTSLGELMPFDPNLVCPMCGRNFRMGEIQKFRRHVPNCKGT